MEITISDRVIVPKTNKCAKHFSSVSLRRWVRFCSHSFHFVSLLLTFVLIYGSLCGRVRPPPPEKMVPKKIETMTLLMRKGPNHDSCHSDNMVRRSSSVNRRRWAHGVCWMAGRMAARFMPQKKINDMLNANKSQNAELGPSESQANNEQNHSCIQISCGMRTQHSWGY